MITMSREYNMDKAIDRACAAQSPEMLPKIPVSKEAQKASIEAKIKAQFESLK